MVFRSALVCRLLIVTALSCAGAYAQPVLYVDASAPPAGDGLTWDTSFNDLQDALDAAAASGGAITQIWVAAGTYTPDRGTHEQALSFALQSGLALYGGFAGGETNFEQRDPPANPTILSGDLLNNDEPGFAHTADNSYHVVTAHQTDSSAILDGFVISGGSSIDLGGDNSVGAGLWMHTATARIAGCQFTRNRANCGGALHCYESDPVVLRCTFHENAGLSAAGAVYNYPQSSPVFVACVFSANTATIQGGAMVNSLNCDVTMLNCGFYGNTAAAFGGGAMLNSHGHAACVNCVFSGNASDSTTWGGGAIRNEQANCELINCTLYGNSANTGGGIFNNFGTELSLANCILWGNTGDAGNDEAAQVAGDGHIPVLSHCCIQGWTGGLGGANNFGHDPVLVDPDGPDDCLGTPDDSPHLDGCASPCTNTGDNAALPPDEFDLDEDGDLNEPLPLDPAGNPRNYDGCVDRGAYETTDAHCDCRDYDQDGDVDFGDFCIFVNCLAGSDNLDPPPGCTPAEFALADCGGDGDVDLVDFATFQAAFTGE